jgi:hypothetical protein
MYSIETISPWELGMACIVCIGYISGKLWMYYTLDSREQSSSLRSIDSKDTKPNEPKRIKSGHKSRVIKRGPEWPE